LEPNRRSVKATTGKLNDPTMIDAIKKQNETAMLNTNKATTLTLKKETIGKYTLPVEMWASGKIESTPYGTFEKMMKINERRKNMSNDDDDDKKNAIKNKMVKSKIVFDHFNYPTTNAAIMKEIPKGKRIQKLTTFANPSIVFNTLPSSVEKEIADLRPTEKFSWINPNPVA
jgi:hypothetical protein